MFGGAKTVPRGPKGQKRPADVIGNAVRVMEIATGQRKEEYEGDQGKDQAAAVRHYPAATGFGDGGTYGLKSLSAVPRTPRPLFFGSGTGDRRGTSERQSLCRSAAQSG